MKESHLILLLQLIQAGGNVSSLLDRGLQFSQIAQLLSEAVAKGYVVQDGSEFHLTNSGLQKMRVELGSNRLRKDGGWISPLEEFRIDKWELDRIYLPSIEDTFFEP
jgi:hypothetical protein